MDAVHFKKLLMGSVGLVMVVFTYTNCQDKMSSESALDKLASPDPATPSPDPATPSPTAGIPTCGSATFVSDSYIGNKSINGQNNWFVDPAANFDEVILDIGSDACRGHGVWKVSNAVISTGFGNQPLSPAFAKSNGESSVKSAGAGDSMSYSFFFRTKNSNADGSSMTVSFSPNGADRHDYLKFVNDSDAMSGMQIFALEGATLSQKYIAKNISRGVWHHIKVVNINPDGLHNDTVNVYLDGVWVGNYTTWEDWRASIPASTLAVSRVLFRLAVAGISVAPTFTNPPEGFYIDDFEQTSFDSTDPNSILERYSTGFEL